MSLNDLLQVYALDYIGIGRTLETILSNPVAVQNPTTAIVDNDHEWLVQQLRALQSHCEQLGLSTAHQLIDDFLGLFSAGPIIYSAATIRTANIARVIEIELQGRL